MIKQLITLGLFTTMFLFGGSAMAKYDTPNYEVIKKEGKIEIRKYSPYIVAEVPMNESRKKTSSKAFPILFNYIGGENKLNKKMPMTVPVTQSEINNEWTFAFILPSDLSIENTPDPLDNRINISQIDSGKRVVIMFSGFHSDSNIQKNKEKLLQYIDQNKLIVEENPIIAFYNHPFTLPFLRRNEIMYIIKE